MAIEVFNRYEKKYILPAAVCEELQLRLADRMDTDAYNKRGGCYTISNLYYDTDDSYLIRASLSKPVYKEKLRLRAYGVPERDGKVFVEIKKKFDGLVNKRRSKLTLEEAYAFLESAKLPEAAPHQNRQVLREVEYILRTYALRPAVYIAYDRCAYFGKDDRNLRISFDQNVRTRRTELRLEAGDHGEPLIDSDVRLMEIKTPDVMPLWLAKLIAEYGVYPASFSKYGTEYKRTLTQSAAVTDIASDDCAELPRAANS